MTATASRNVTVNGSGPAPVAAAAQPAAVNSGAAQQQVTQGTATAAPKISYSLNKVPNELRTYASYNYIFTLACLTPNELNFPDQTYRRSAPSVTVLRSGGGAVGKALTAYENKDNQLEYFIDNIEIDSIIVPTNATRTSNATTLSFEVFEPYSMGLFLQTLQIAARNAGHLNYNRAPYALIIEFIGYDDNGNVVTNSKTRRVFPFKFVSVDFDVTAGGSKYAVSGVAWNEQAQSNVVQTVNVDASLVGNNVLEILQKGPNSLSSILNQRLREKEAKGEGIFRDEYIIIFPQDLISGIGSVNTAPTGQADSATLDPKQAYFRLTGIPPESQDPQQVEAAKEVIQNYINLQAANNAISGSLRSLVADESKVNAIGRATMAKGMAEGGNVPFGRPKFTLKTVGDKQFYDNGQVQISQDFRTFQFPQGTSVEKIIEEIVILSSYGQAAATSATEDRDGNIPWFRIQTQVYMAPDPAVLTQTGENPKIYVYMVVPYDVHSSVFSSPTTPSNGIENRKVVARKEYNYIYTGKNEDILDFQIQLNNNFYSAIAPDNGVGTSGVRLATTQGTNTPTNNSAYKVNEGGQGLNSQTGISRATESLIQSQVSGGGGGYTNTSIEVARQFNEAIVNAKADLLTMELTIMGDPYYMADTGIGNYNSPPTEPGINRDGTMAYQNAEVDVILNFRTPIDYNRNTGAMIFPEDTVPVRAFSGLYKVNLVRHKFSGAKFEQVLEMIRRPNQESDIGATGSPTAARVLQPAQKGKTELATETSTTPPGGAQA